MEQLFKKQWEFTAGDVRKNILVPFYTDRAFDRLVLKLHYTPKSIRDPAIIGPQIRACVETYFPSGHQLTEEDMKEYDQLLNFVTLSLDHGETYVGCAHRHPPEQTIVISPAGSTWGFDSVAVTAGAWRVVLHVQAVVVGTVTYRLAVYGMEGGESDAAIPAL